MTEADAGPKGGKIFWNDTLEDSFKEIKTMVSADNLLNYLYWAITFTVHTDTYDKEVSDVIRQNNKPIDFFIKKIKKSTT